MKLDTPEISWHGRQPVYSLDFQPVVCEPRRLVTASADANVRVWYIKINKDGKISPEFAANLYRHTKPVNVVRFSPDGQIIASGADDGLVILWRLQDGNAGSVPFGKEEEEESGTETWTVFKMLRGHLEDIYDISWSRDSSRLITGSVDNSAIAWDVVKGEKIELMNDHRSFVQGVAWDPLNQYCVTMSCDRSMRVYSLQNFRCVHNVTRLAMAENANNGESQTKQVRMFHDDSMKSFFRRLTYTPDGQLLIVPSGCLETGDAIANTTFVFSRLSYSKPVLHLPGTSKPTIAVRCCPILFQLRKPESDKEVGKEKNGTEEPMDTSDGSSDSKEKSDPSKEDKKQETEKKDATPAVEPQLFDLPYRIVFSVATEDAILFYDTQQSIPFAYVSNIHYSTINDISWSANGNHLSVASTDGYISIVSFEPKELGEPYEPIRKEKSSTGNKDADKLIITENSEKKVAVCENKDRKKIDTVMISDNKEVAATLPKSIEDAKQAVNQRTNVSTNINPGKKEPRRIATTMLSSSPSSNPQPRRITPTAISSPSSNLSTTSGTPQPRRIALTTLTTETNQNA